MEISSTISVKELSQAETKILYTELIAGTSPAEIIARHGYPPSVVQRDHDRMKKKKNIPIVKLQEFLLQYFNAYDSSPSLGEYCLAFKEKGSLTFEQTKQVIDIGTLDAAWNMGARQYWVRLNCQMCGQLIAISNPYDGIGADIIRQYWRCRHYDCSRLH